MTTAHSKPRLRLEHFVYRLNQVDQTRREAGHEPIHPILAVCLFSALGLTAAFGLTMLTPPLDEPRVEKSAVTTAPAGPNAHRVILNALLVPALDADALPLRWVDPRPAMACGSGTTVRVNGAPLVAGALVPDTPFELAWHADGCRPFGARGLRFDGDVKLTVFREDWGFSAMVQPVALRVASDDSETTLTASAGAWLPQCADADEPIELAALGEGDSLPCR